nr:T9SS type A sorting domain-containing protein [bacterium]
NSDDPINFPSYFSIYDTSVPNEFSLIYQTQIDSDNMLSAELFEDYFIRKTGNHQYTVYNLENFDGTCVVDNIYLVPSTKFKDEGAVLLDYNDNCYYYYIIDEDGILQKKYNLGDSARRIAIDGDKLITYSIGDVNFYNITETDSLEYRGTFYLSQALPDYHYSIAYMDDRIAFTSYEGIIPAISKLFLYDVSDVSSVYTIELLDSVDISNRPFSQGRTDCSLVQNGNNLYIASLNGYFLLRATITNDIITLEDIGQSSIINLDSWGLLKNNIFYVNNIQRNFSMSTYSLENISNVQEIPNSFPEHSMYRFLENQQKVIRYDEMTGTIFLYDFSGNDLELEATYQPQPFIPQGVFSVLKWDGTHFIYRSLSSLYSLKYENGEFISTWSISNDDFYFYKYSYAIYNGYLYEHNTDTGVKVHEYNVEEINQINSLTIPFNDTWDGAFLAGDILTIANKVVDLSYDPINLSHRYNLNQNRIQHGPVKYNDYLVYCGEEKIYENGVLVDYEEGVSIYKLIDDNPVRVGQIASGWAGSVKVLPGGTADSFDLLVYHNNFYGIYSCQATPNGNLEITPVTLKAVNYPNPFNPETTISYDISQQSQVTVDIYNIKGQKVKSLLKENQEAGQHSIIWKGDNNEGKRVSSGSYFYRVKSGDE